MVKPAIYPTDPAEQKAIEKAKEAGEVQIPIKTEVQYAVPAAEGARTGCSGRWKKIAFGVVTSLLVIGIVVTVAITLASSGHGVFSCFSGEPGETEKHEDREGAEHDRKHDRPGHPLHGEDHDPEDRRDENDGDQGKGHEHSREHDHDSGHRGHDHDSGHRGHDHDSGHRGHDHDRDHREHDRDQSTSRDEDEHDDADEAPGRY